MGLGLETELGRGLGPFQGRGRARGAAIDEFGDIPPPPMSPPCPLRCSELPRFRLWGLLTSHWSARLSVIALSQSQPGPGRGGRGPALGAAAGPFPFLFPGPAPRPPRCPRGHGRGSRPRCCVNEAEGPPGPPGTSRCFELPRFRLCGALTFHWPARLSLIAPSQSLRAWRRRGRGPALGGTRGDGGGGSGVGPGVGPGAGPADRRGLGQRPRGRSAGLDRDHRDGGGRARLRGQRLRAPRRRRLVPVLQRRRGAGARHREAPGRHRGGRGEGAGVPGRTGREGSGSVFGSRCSGSRCSRVPQVAAGPVVTDVLVLSERSPQPPGYSRAPEFPESRGSVSRRKRLWVRREAAAAVAVAVLELRLGAKGGGALPGLSRAGEMGGFAIWCRKGPVGPGPGAGAGSSPGAGAGSSPGAGAGSSPGLGSGVSADLERLSLRPPRPPPPPAMPRCAAEPAAISGISAMDGIPFALHPKFEQQLSSPILAELTVKSLAEIEREYSYGFLLERTAAARLPPG